MAHEHLPRTPGPSPSHDTVEVFLPSAPPYVGMSRRIAAGAMERWGGIPPEVAADTVLIVSELMTNAVQHGGGADSPQAVGLRMEHRDGQLLVEVTDNSSEPARRKVARETATNGRGLHLVEKLAAAWGTSNTNHTTWARVSTEPQGPTC
ncbi:ATP-binding protein [Streptomyces changanensis]|nr:MULTISPECIES: ATP-binding protein [Streptomyces]UUS34023.1 ATP-binding protein [Streptomyces changanensis]